MNANKEKKEKFYERSSFNKKEKAAEPEEVFTSKVALSKIRIRLAMGKEFCEIYQWLAGEVDSMKDLSYTLENDFKIDPVLFQEYVNFYHAHSSVSMEFPRHSLEGAHLIDCDVPK